MSETADRESSKSSRLHRLGRRLTESRHVLWGLGVASFLESIIVPIPLEAILIPLMQARRHQLFLLAGIALLGCLLGATLGYAVGYFVFEAIGEQLVEWLSSPEQFQRIQQKMETGGFWFVLSVGVRTSQDRHDHRDHPGCHCCLGHIPDHLTRRPGALIKLSAIKLCTIYLRRRR